MPKSVKASIEEEIARLLEEVEQAKRNKEFEYAMILLDKVQELRGGDDE